MRSFSGADQCWARSWTSGSSYEYGFYAHVKLSHQYHGRTQAIVGDNNGMAGQDLPRGNDLCGADMSYMQGTCANGKADLLAVPADFWLAVPWLD